MRFTPKRLKLSNPFQHLATTDRQVLAVCLVSAFIFWLILNLSQEYEITKEVTVDYTYSPDRTLAGTPPTSIPVQLKGQGWNLIWESLVGSTIPVTIDLADQPQVELKNIQLQQEIRRRLSSGAINIVSLNYEARSVLTTPLAGKRVPVISRITVEYEPGYAAAGRLRLYPDSVTVSGSEDALDTISEWYTEPLAITNVQEKVIREVALAKPAGNININYATVSMDLPVAAYIEQRIPVPVTVLNAPLVDSSRVYPREVTLHVTVLQRDFGRFTADDFTVIADLDRMQTNDNHNLVPLLLADFPEEVKSIQFEPRAAEYYVYRKGE